MASIGGIDIRHRAIYTEAPKSNLEERAIVDTTGSTVEMIGSIGPHCAFSLVPVSFLSQFDIVSLSDSNAML
jgi:hypothetical protein